MFQGFGHTQHGGETDVGLFEALGPFLPATGLEDRRNFLPLLRPAMWIHLLTEIRSVEFEMLAEFCIELGFDRGDRYELPIRTLEGVVEMRAAIDDAATASLAEFSGR